MCMGAFTCSQIDRQCLIAVEHDTRAPIFRLSTFSKLLALFTSPVFVIFTFSKRELDFLIQIQILSIVRGRVVVKKDQLVQLDLVLTYRYSIHT